MPPSRIKLFNMLRWSSIDGTESSSDQFTTNLACSHWTSCRNKACSVICQVAIFCGQHCQRYNHNRG